MSPVSCDGPHTFVLPTSTEQLPAPGPLHTTAALLRPRAASLLPVLTCRLLHCLQIPNDPERASVKEICSLHFGILVVKKKAHYRDRPGRGSAPHGPPLSGPDPTRPAPRAPRPGPLTPSDSPQVGPHSVPCFLPLSGGLWWAFRAKHTCTNGQTDVHTTLTRTCTSLQTLLKRSLYLLNHRALLRGCRQSLMSGLHTAPGSPGLGEPGLVKASVAHFCIV